VGGRSADSRDWTFRGSELQRTGTQVRAASRPAASSQPGAELATGANVAWVRCVPSASNGVSTWKSWVGAQSSACADQETSASLCSVLVRRCFSSLQKASQRHNDPTAAGRGKWGLGWKRESWRPAWWIRRRLVVGEQRVRERNCTEQGAAASG